VADVDYMTLYYPNNKWAHQCQLAFAGEGRTTLIGGEKINVGWNDLEADEKLKFTTRACR